MNYPMKGTEEITGWIKATPSMGCKSQENIISSRFLIL